MTDGGSPSVDPEANKYRAGGGTNFISPSGQNSSLVPSTWTMRKPHPGVTAAERDRLRVRKKGSANFPSLLHLPLIEICLRSDSACPAPGAAAKRGRGNGEGRMKPIPIATSQICRFEVEEAREKQNPLHLPADGSETLRGFFGGDKNWRQK